MSDSSQREYRKAILSFIDILGFKELVEKSSPSVVYEILEIFHEHTENNRLFGSMGDENYIPEQTETYKPEIIFFSDSVIRIVFPDDFPLTQTIKGKSSDIAYTHQLFLDEFLPFRDELVNLCFIQEKLLSKGVLIRGGIVYGDVIYDKEKQILFGPALQKAYYIESEIALHPRIVIDSSVIEKATTEGIFHVNALINKSESGFDYIDYIGGSIRWHWNILTNRLLDYPILYLPKDFTSNDIIAFYRERLDFELLKLDDKKACIEKGLNKYFSVNLPVFIKYAWLAEKYNESLDEFFSLYDDYLTNKQRDEGFQISYEIKYPDITQKIEELRKLAFRSPKRLDYLIELAKALVNLAASQDLLSMLQTQKELCELAERFPENIEIAIQLGNNLFNLSLRQKTPSEKEQTVGELRCLFARFPDKRVAFSLAMILVNLSATQDLSSRQVTISELRELYSRFPEDAGIASMLAIGLVHFLFDGEQSFLNSAKGMEELTGLINQFPKDTRMLALKARFFPFDLFYNGVL